jgi:ribonucleoside-triphosphate reductase
VDKVQMFLPGLEPEPEWGPSGKQVYERTYSRTKSDGTKETWYDTVKRVVDGNLALVPEQFHLPGEREELFDAIFNFRLLPGGRHLWMSGVEGRQFLFNCYVAGWGENLSDHFTFTFDQLMQGGGVGSNYSYNVMPKYNVQNLVTTYFILSPEHPDYIQVKRAFEGLGMYRVLATSIDKIPYGVREAGVHVVADSREGWVEALKLLLDAASETCTNESFMDMEAGVYTVPVIYDLSQIRASGEAIKTFGGTSAGPGPLLTMLFKINRHLASAWVNEFNGPVAMEIDHIISECVVSGNVRRSARMSMMQWDDPWIEYFLTCKKDGLDQWSTNISVIVDDNFISKLDSGDEYATDLFNRMVEATLTNGEPGFFNISLAQEGERGKILATNPCGEITLEPWENCNLGHVNLDRFANSSDDAILHHHTLMTRFLLRATFGDISNPRTQEVSNRNRRIGVGHTGVAGFLAKRGINYDEASFDTDFKTLLSNCYIRVRATADIYADQLGVPRPVKVTTVAPTGTVSKMPGVTEGIHPPYAKYFLRRIRYSTVDPDQVAATKRYRSSGYRVVDDIYAPNTVVVEIPTKERLVSELENTAHEVNIKSIEDITVSEALNFQLMYQSLYADNAISYTVNVPEGQYTTLDIAEVLKFYLPMLKGTTLMVDESRELAPYQRITREVYDRYKDGHVDSGYDEACASGACPVR